MRVDWLKSLAVRLRGLLAEQGIDVSHGRALDLIAAVPGLRDWPEVMAFPDRLAACRFDDDAVERLARRVAARHALTIADDRFLFALRWMSQSYQSSSASKETKRLIVTTGDSGAGHLGQSGIADRVIRSHAFDRLVSGPVPAARDAATFFKTREAAYDADPMIDEAIHDWNRAGPALAWWTEVLALCEDYERIELWIDPDPDAQLRLVQMLCWLRERPDLIGKLHVVHADDALGERGAQAIATMNPRIHRIDDDSLQTAARAWDAWCSATPEAWFALLGEGLEALPHLRRTVLLLLGELPDRDTALGATERLLLQIVEPGRVRPTRFFHVDAQDNPSRVFDYFEEMRIVRRLCNGDPPAIEGLQDLAFGIDAMRDAERRERYMQSELSLTALGRALIARSDDFSRHNAIHRWWGGTLLSNERLWRWDGATRRLIAPY